MNQVCEDLHDMLIDDFFYGIHQLRYQEGKYSHGFCQKYLEADLCTSFPEECPQLLPIEDWDLTVLTHRESELVRMLYIIHNKLMLSELREDKAEAIAKLRKLVDDFLDGGIPCQPCTEET